VIEALCARGAITVSVSEEAGSELRRYYRVRIDNVIPNGIDTATFSPGDRADARAALGLDRERRYALFVGRLEPRKGSDLVLAGASAAGYELLVAGPRGAPGATHLGVLEPGRLADAYRAADCMLFPTRYEGCSLAILEALASGVPVVTTPVGWMPTFLAAVPEYQALCIESSVASITERLRSLPQLVTEDLLSQARRYVVAENSLGRWTERWHALLVRAGYPGPDRA
jgi:glycosyltransferase involved in cell wall biosynthesis